MDELSMFTALKPPPDQVDVSGARNRLADAIAGAPGRPAPSRRTRLVMAGGLAAVAAAAAIAVPIALAGGNGASKVTHASWTVDVKQNGTVTLTVQQLFANLNGLQRTLRADGVPAVVALVPWKITIAHGGIQAIQACGYGRYIARTSEPGSVQHAVITHPVVKPVFVYTSPDVSLARVGKNSSGPFSWIIHPSAMPSGSVLFIVASGTVSKEAVSATVGVPVVLRGDRAAVCVPGDGVASESMSG
jgi:hypothetical protein